MKWRHDDQSSLCFSESVHETCQRQPTELKLGKLIVHSKFHKICKFENHVTRNDVIMMSLPKTMENNGEIRTSAKPNKLYINRKVLMRAIQKCTSYWIWATMSKGVGNFVKFGIFLRCPLTKYGHITWPKKQISKIFYFVLILFLISWKVTRFLVEKLSTSEVISQKPHGGWKTPPSAFRVKFRASWNGLFYFFLNGVFICFTHFMNSEMQKFDIFFFTSKHGERKQNPPPLK